METPWHILRVAPNAEKEALALLRTDAQLYVPMFRRSCLNRRQRVRYTRVMPMLPGYIFVHVDNPLHVKLTPSKLLFGFARNGNRSPMFVRDRDMKKFVAYESQKEADFLAREAQYQSDFEARKGFSPCVGDKVKLQTGLFAGFEAIVKALSSSSEVSVELDGLFNMRGEFKTPSANLRLASAV